MLIFDVISQFLACFPHRTLRGTLFFTTTQLYLLYFYVFAHTLAKVSQEFPIFSYSVACALLNKNMGVALPGHSNSGKRPGQRSSRAIHSCSSYVPTARESRRNANRQAGKLRPMSRRVIISLHGFHRRRRFFSRVAYGASHLL